MRPSEGPFPVRKNRQKGDHFDFVMITGPDVFVASGISDTESEKSITLA